MTGRKFMGQNLQKQAEEQLIAAPVIAGEQLDLLFDANQHCKYQTYEFKPYPYIIHVYENGSCRVRGPLPYTRQIDPLLSDIEEAKILIRSLFNKGDGNDG